jgi:hypothetical protein
MGHQAEAEVAALLRSRVIEDRIGGTGRLQERGDLGVFIVVALVVAGDGITQDVGIPFARQVDQVELHELREVLEAHVARVARVRLLRIEPQKVSS